jgi:LmbE family N-acetylglucosaminyl deacetylase
MRVLVIAPHPDDEAIGCGGTVLLHGLDRGDRVACVFLTSGELGLRHLAPEEAWRIREAEAEQAAGILGIQRLEFLRQPDWYLSEHVEAAATALGPILDREAPEIVYLPHQREGHPDHRAALPILRRALDAGGGHALPTLLTYEVWTPLSEHYHVENITPHMRRKLAAIRAHRSQVSQLAYDRAICGLNAYRGVVAGGCRFAEIFQTVTLEPTAAFPRPEAAAEVK